MAGRWLRLARSALVREEEEDSWLGRVGQKAGWAGWPIGPKVEGKFFSE
jgi:hypothetical protein